MDRPANSVVQEELPITWVRFEWVRTIWAINLVPNTKLVGLAVADFADNETGKGAHPGQKLLAQMTKLSERAVREHIDVLEHLGLLNVEKHGWGNAHGSRANVYALDHNPPDLLDHIKRWNGITTSDCPGIASDCPTGKAQAPGGRCWTALLSEAQAPGRRSTGTGA